MVCRCIKGGQNFCHLASMSCNAVQSVQCISLNIYRNTVVVRYKLSDLRYQMGLVYKDSILCNGFRHGMSYSRPQLVYEHARSHSLSLSLSLSACIVTHDHYGYKSNNKQLLANGHV